MKLFCKISVTCTALMIANTGFCDEVNKEDEYISLYKFLCSKNENKCPPAEIIQKTTMLSWGCGERNLAFMQYVYPGDNDERYNKPLVSMFSYNGEVNIPSGYTSIATLAQSMGIAVASQSKLKNVDLGDAASLLSENTLITFDDEIKRQAYSSVLNHYLNSGEDIKEVRDSNLVKGFTSYSELADTVSDSNTSIAIGLRGVIGDSWRYLNVEGEIIGSEDYPLQIYNTIAFKNGEENEARKALGQLFLDSSLAIDAENIGKY